MTTDPGNTAEPQDRQASPDTGDAAPSAADQIVSAFGGIRPMAHKLEMPVTTVQGWKKRGAIPQQRHDAIRAAALAHGIALDEATLKAAAPPEAPTGTGPAVSAGRSSATSAIPSVRRQPAAPRDHPGRLAVAALVLALIALGIAITSPFWFGHAARLVGTPLEAGTAAGVDAAQLEALDARIASLEQRTEALAASGGDRVETGAMTAQLQAMDRRLSALEQIATPALADRVAAVGGAVDALAGDVSRLDGALGNQRAGLTEARAVLSSLEERADAVETQLDDFAATQRRDGRRIDRLVASDSAAQALVLAVGQLRVAVDAGRPYSEPLAALQGLAAGIDESADDLATLAPRAATGIPDFIALKGRFPAMAEAVREAVLLPADADWMDQAIARIEGLVTVRPAPGEVEGDDVEAVLARAEGRLENGDLSGAVAAIARLDGDAAAAAADWRRAAESRIAAEEALDNLTGLAIARLAQGASEGSTP